MNGDQITATINVLLESDDLRGKVEDVGDAIRHSPLAAVIVNAHADRLKETVPLFAALTDTMAIGIIIGMSLVNDGEEVYDEGPSEEEVAEQARAEEEAVAAEVLRRSMYRNIGDGVAN